MHIQQLTEEELIRYTQKLKDAITPSMKVTIFQASEFTAMTTRRLMIITGAFGPEFRPHYSGARFGKYRIATIRSSGSRREQYYLDVGANDLVLRGWDLPVKTEFEVTHTTLGDATLRLCAPSCNELRQIIRSLNINPFFQEREVFFVTPSEKEFGENVCMPVFPQVVEVES